MHPNLKVILALWDVDKRLDANGAEQVVLARGITDSAAHVATLAKRLKAAETSRAALSTEEQKLDKDLDSYLRRKAKAERVLRGDVIGDVGAAQRQLHQCTEIIEGLEVTLLENMEAGEKADAHGRELHEALNAAREVAAVAVQCQADSLPGLQAAAQQLERDRSARYADLRDDHQRRYLELRRRGRVVVAQVSGKQCAACHFQIQPQALIEVAQGRRMQSCRGCHAWLALDLQVDEPGDDG